MEITHKIGLVKLNRSPHATLEEIDEEDEKKQIKEGINHFHLQHDIFGHKKRK